jgi:hypothetical protein
MMFYRGNADGKDGKGGKILEGAQSPGVGSSAAESDDWRCVRTKVSQRNSVVKGF